MVFYFSGTGNSYQAALAMCREGERPIDMAKCLRDGSFRFDPGENAAVGFCLPVYYGGLPSVVTDFLRRFLLLRPAGHCFAVLTCGGFAAAAPEMLRKALHARGVRLDAAYSVVMPENYVMLFRTPEAQERDAILSEAAKRLDAIRAAVDCRLKTGVRVSARDRLLTAGMYPAYVHGRKTEKFFSDDSCVGCGVCAKRCPVGAIAMVDGHPQWVLDRCVHCQACLRCNAVQYGNRTQGKLRYVNPILKAAKTTEHHH